MYVLLALLVTTHDSLFCETHKRDARTLGQNLERRGSRGLGIFPTKRKAASVCSLDVLSDRASDDSRVGNMRCIDSQGAMTKHRTRSSLGVPCLHVGRLIQRCLKVRTTRLGGVWEVVSYWLGSEACWRSSDLVSNKSHGWTVRVAW
jgi:hypothetical protein